MWARDSAWKTGAHQGVPTISLALAISLLGGVRTTGAFDMNRKAIHGVIADQTDSPIPNALVNLSCVHRVHGNTETKTKTGTDGRFRLDSTLPGECRVNIFAPGFLSVVIRVKASGNKAGVDLGKVRLRISCSGPGVICDEVTSKAEPPKK